MQRNAQAPTRCRPSLSPRTIQPADAPQVTARRQPKPLVELMAPGDQLYFAFGANMSPATLTNRRGVLPKASIPAVITGYVLSFRLKGFPYIEPGFGTIERSRPGDRGDVHGVVHLVTKRDWERVRMSEGANNNTGYGYQVVCLPCQTYDGEVLDVNTLQASDVSLAEGDARYARTSGLGVTAAVRPSVRYLQILRDGAKHHNLSQEYQDWLGRLPAYEPTPLSGLGAAALLPYAGLGVGLATASHLATNFWGGGGGKAAEAATSARAGQWQDGVTRGAQALRDDALDVTTDASLGRDAATTASQVLWAAHDWLVAPVLGRGA